MCDHCSKVTSQKGYAGQVTCKCEHGEKKDEDVGKEKDFGGCCSKKEKKTDGGCCQSKCCPGTKEDRGGCCTAGASKDQKGCCPHGK
ncbi:hypothetical protein KM043_006685 [Ampulex compressa]|nr:hypothetical protein KM043_006685 [Ampulex compressa]